LNLHQPDRRSAAAFQLAAVLEELDVEVARLQLNPRARTLLTSGREYIAKARGFCELLGIPSAAPDDLESALKELLREIATPDEARDLGARVSDVRQVTHALRALCIAVLAKTSPI
jgi:hypothetical protein